MCCIALYVVPSVIGIFERTYIAEHGKIDVADEVSAFIVRDERVYVAAQKSKINRLADSNRLVNAGTKVVELTPTEETLDLEAMDEDAESEEAETKDKSKADSAKKTDEKKDDKKDEKKSGKSDDKKSGNKDSEKAEEPEEQDPKLGILGSKYSGIMEELGDTYSVTEDGTTRTAGYVSYYVDGAD